MDIASLIINYRDLKFLHRVIGLCLLGMLPSFYDFSESALDLFDEISRSKQKLEKANTAFHDAKKKQAALPAFEKNLTEMEEDLEEASQILPDSFDVNKMLTKTAMIADDLKVDLKSFTPGLATMPSAGFLYIKRPIFLKISGTYSQIATFFDRLVHLEVLVNIENIELKLKSLTSETPTAAQNSSMHTAAVEELRLLEMRANTRLEASARMIIFRTLTRQESSELKI